MAIENISTMTREEILKKLQELAIAQAVTWDMDDRKTYQQDTQALIAEFDKRFKVRGGGQK